LIQLNLITSIRYRSNLTGLWPIGVRERTFHQHTPQGDFVIVTLEGNDPAGAIAKFGQGTDPFTQWFKGQVVDSGA
jgi:small ligand-binding sensory domain FIST